jgi:hypothetical protein
MDYLVKAIRLLKPNSQFSFIDDDYSTIKWDVLEGDAPTQAEIDKAIKQVKLNEEKIEAEKQHKRQEIADRLGLTADELKLLLG